MFRDFSNNVAIGFSNRLCYKEMLSDTKSLCTHA